MKVIGKFDIEIGPHIFYDTVLFDVRYPITPRQPVHSGPVMHSLTHHSSPGPSFSNGSSSGVDLISPSVEVTPALISQVNQAAATNPVLQNLLQLAATGRASHDQLKTLGILVQSLAMQQNLSPSQDSHEYDRNASDVGFPDNSSKILLVCSQFY